MLPVLLLCADMEFLWRRVKAAIDDGTADHCFILQHEAASPISEAQTAASFPGSTTLGSPLQGSPKKPIEIPPDGSRKSSSSLESPTRTGDNLEQFRLSLRQATWLAAEACHRNDASILSLLSRLGLAGHHIDPSVACEKDDISCARVLHDSFDVSFSTDLFKKACLNGYTELAGYMQATRDPPCLSSVEEFKFLLSHAAARFNAGLMAIIMDACDKSVPGSMVITSMTEELLIIVSSTDHSEEDLEQRLGVLTFLLERGATLPDFITKVTHGDAKDVKTMRQVELVARYLQNLVSNSSDLSVAAWNKKNLHSCSSEVFFIDKQPLPLVIVDLSSNRLTSLPCDLFDGALASLKRLDVSNNDLSSLFFDQDMDFSKSK